MTSRQGPSRPYDEAGSRWPSVVDRWVADLPTSAPPVLASDIDGTLLSFGNFFATPSQGTIDALDRARQAGLEVVVATGRSLHSVRPFLERAGLDSGVVVCANGAVVADVVTGEVLHAETFEANEPVRYFAQHIPDAILAVEVLGSGFRITGSNDDMGFDGDVVITDHDHLVQGPVTRLVVRWDDGGPEELRRIAAHMGLPAVDYVIGRTAWLDIMPHGVSKASGLQWLVDQGRFRRDHVIGVGDGNNDVELVKWSGLGLAVANSVDELLWAADAVIPAAEDDGVARMLHRVVDRWAATTG